MPDVRTAITKEPLDPAAAIAEVTDPECGGIGLFVGTVRSSAAAGSRTDVRGLEYDIHPTLAAQRLDVVATTAAARWDLRHVVVEHRSGRCDVGEPAVVIACSAPHRAEALEACRWIIDEIKREVPIWKREIYADGSSWVGAGA